MKSQELITRRSQTLFALALKLALFAVVVYGPVALAITRGEAVTAESYEPIASNVSQNNTVTFGPQNSVVGFSIKIREGRMRNVKAVNYCTGVILSEHVVLTAAHCFPKRNASESYSVTMTFGPDVEKEGFYRAIISDKQVIKHATADLALVRLRETLPENARSVQLPATDSLPTTASSFSLNTPITILGYGADQLNSSFEFNKALGHLHVAQSQFSAFSSDRGILSIDQKTQPGICKGDSGGPALIPVEETEDSASDASAAAHSFVIAGIANTVKASLTTEQSSSLKRTELQEFLKRNPEVDFCAGTGNFLDIRPHAEWIRRNM